MAFFKKIKTKTEIYSAVGMLNKLTEDLDNKNVFKADNKYWQMYIAILEENNKIIDVNTELNYFKGKYGEYKLLIKEKEDDD